MAKIKHPDEIAFAGDYNLAHIDLFNHKGEVLDLKHIVQELNIYESIYKNAITGSVVVIDANNFIGKMEIQGLERLSFKLETPGLHEKELKIDASMETGEPFHVYKISDRRQLNDNTTLYILHFASREFMRNIRTKVSQAYNSRLDMSVMKILKDKDYLDSRKDFYYEPAGNTDKIVVPNLRPFDAINMIAKRTLPDKSHGVGYYFYETTKGFHFRSWENMCSVDGNLPRHPKQTFYYMQMKIDDPDIEDKIGHEYKSVESYRFINNFHDVAANTALGTYGHRVITHNMFDKTHNESDYNYHTQFSASVHADHENNYTDQSKHAVVDSVVDYDNETNVSDYPESRVSLQSSTKFLHNDDVGRYGIDAFNDSSTTGQRVSQKNQVVHGTLLKLVVKGQSYLEAGDVIEFNIRPQDTHKELVDVKDHRFAGKYIVVKIRHQIANSEYKMVLECAKDSSYSALASGTVKWKTKNSGALFSTYKDDQGSM
tara:strand:- start:3141 stop:4598 length:1458 start_codon:yes stop_codon:yes gene_type:complete